ncbi:hypothetical protein B0H19DRAFT_451126 [Mycena capillaripes]|nr:hypothetical protein B0H19DRAFT_451126 [Mycena capillaripes]
MDEWQFSQPYWDGSSEAQRRSAPAPGVLPSFGFPTDSGFLSIAATPSINLADIGHPTPLLFPDLFPGASQPAFHSDFSSPASWDGVPFLAGPVFHSNRANMYDPSVQPHCDDFVYRCDTWFHFNSQCVQRKKETAASRAFSQRRLDPLPRVRVQEIFMITMGKISS